MSSDNLLVDYDIPGDNIFDKSACAIRICIVPSVILFSPGFQNDKVFISFSENELLTPSVQMTYLQSNRHTCSSLCDVYNTTSPDVL